MSVWPIQSLTLHSPFPVTESDLSFNPISKPLLLLPVRLLSPPFSLFFAFSFSLTSHQHNPSIITIYYTFNLSDLVAVVGLFVCGSLDPDPLLNPHSGLLFFLGIRSLSSVNHPPRFNSLLASLVFTVYLLMAFWIPFYQVRLFHAEFWLLGTQTE